MGKQSREIEILHIRFIDIISFYATGLSMLSRSPWRPCYKARDPAIKLQLFFKAACLFSRNEFFLPSWQTKSNAMTCTSVPLALCAFFAIIVAVARRRIVTLTMQTRTCAEHVTCSRHLDSPTFGRSASLQPIGHGTSVSLTSADPQ